MIRPDRLPKVATQVTRRQILTAVGASVGAAAISVNAAAQSDEAGPPTKNELIRAVARRSGGGSRPADQRAHAPLA